MRRIKSFHCRKMVLHFSTDLTGGKFQYSYKKNHMHRAERTACSQHFAVSSVSTRTTAQSICSQSSKLTNDLSICCLLLNKGCQMTILEAVRGSGEVNCVGII